MIKVKFDPENLPPEQRAFWTQWEAKARAATLQIIEEWEKWVSDPATKDQKFPSANFDQDIWKELRDFLKGYFNNKCAYCETEIIGFKAHAEHFRPKAQVRFKVAVGDKQVYRMGRTRDEKDEEIDHPGYFWLAYNWKNLLPACQKCNTLEGKKDQFPIAPDKSYVAVKKLTAEEVKNLRWQITKREGAEDIFYLEPEDLDTLENPQLLHPYFDEPRDHLVFGRHGDVAPRNKSEKGRHSIAVFDLNDEDLRGARQSQQKVAYRDYMHKINDTESDSPVEVRKKGEEVLAKYRQGKEKYSAAAIDYIHHMLDGSRYFDPYIPVEDLEKDEEAGG